METESSRRWREEERETGLLGRRERRKTDRRAEHDVNNRNSGVDTRRDNKWSSRWGPDDKEKENRTEKRIDVDKEDVHNDGQTFVANHTVSERESDSRDKWRPRYKMEGNSAAPSSYRAAPGFGQERGKVEGSNVGFNLGRGRSTGTIRRPSSGGAIGASPFENSVPGKSGISTGIFSYPRGKALDIYRRQKLGSSLCSMPENMEEAPPVTQVIAIEPLAFVVPDAEEEVSYIYYFVCSDLVGFLSFKKIFDTRLLDQSYYRLFSMIYGRVKLLVVVFLTIPLERVNQWIMSQVIVSLTPCLDAVLTATRILSVVFLK